MAGGNDNLQKAARWLRDARRVVVFTGAGISADSGIPTFRDLGGLWDRFPPEEFANWHGIVKAFWKKPRLLAEFVGEVFGPVARAEPNAAHLAIADLERHAQVSVVTQNIDGLHRSAGSTIVHEIHGSLFEIGTFRGHVVRRLSRQQLAARVAALSRASRGWFPHAQFLLALRPIIGLGMRGIYRPNVVLFGEGLTEPAWTQAQDDATNADLMISIGSSATVYPAATLPHKTSETGGKLIVIDPAGGDGDLVLRGSATEIVPTLVSEAFG